LPNTLCTCSCCSWSKISASKCTFSVHDIVLLIIHLAAAQTDDRLEISRALPSSLRFTRLLTAPGFVEGRIDLDSQLTGLNVHVCILIGLSLHEQPPIILRFLRFLFLVLKISKQFFLRARLKTKKRKTQNVSWGHYSFDPHKMIWTGNFSFLTTYNNRSCSFMMKVVNLWCTLVMHVLLKNQIVSFTQKMYIVQIKLDSQLL
jgi:hypothetical protein